MVILDGQCILQSVWTFRLYRHHVARPNVPLLALYLYISCWVYLILANISYLGMMLASGYTTRHALVNRCILLGYAKAAAQMRADIKLKSIISKRRRTIYEHRNKQSHEVETPAPPSTDSQRRAHSVTLSSRGKTESEPGGPPSESMAGAELGRPKSVTLPAGQLQESVTRAGVGQSKSGTALLRESRDSNRAAPEVRFMPVSVSDGTEQPHARVRAQRVLASPDGALSDRARAKSMTLPKPAIKNSGSRDSYSSRLGGSGQTAVDSSQRVASDVASHIPTGSGQLIAAPPTVFYPDDGR